VREMIEHGRNGLLTDFFDTERIAEAASQVLDRPGDCKPLGQAGVEMIRERYSLDVCLPRMLALYEDPVHARREQRGIHWTARTRAPNNRDHCEPALLPATPFSRRAGQRPGGPHESISRLQHRDDRPWACVHRRTGAASIRSRLETVPPWRTHAG